MPLVTAAFSTGGSVTITDAVEVTAINALTSAITLNTGALETINLTLISLLGPEALVLYPSGLTACASQQEDNTRAIHRAILKQTETMEKLIMSINKVSNSMATSTTGLANIQHTMQSQLTTQQLAVADQIKNNKFQQTTTNAALVDAGKPPTVVKPDSMAASVQSAVQDVSVIKAQTLGATLVEEGVTNAIAQGYKVASEWVAQTAFAKWVQDYFLEAKLQTKILFADEKTKRELELQLQKLKASKSNPIQSAGDIPTDNVA